LIERPPGAGFRPRGARRLHSAGCAKFHPCYHAPGQLSRPCARLETELGGFLLGVTTTLCTLIVIGMLWRGGDILEWLEEAGEPR